VALQGILYPEELEKKIKPLLRIISSSQPLDNDRLGP
jgi:hypothetical protein